MLERGGMEKSGLMLWGRIGNKCRVLFEYKKNKKIKIENNLKHCKTFALYGIILVKCKRQNNIMYNVKSF